MLSNENISVRGIIERSNVETIVTTDDPIDTLEWHKTISEDDSFKVKVLPGMRPDKAMNIDKPGFTEYVQKLANVTEKPIKTLNDMLAALEERIDFFHKMGCISSDHGLDYVPFAVNSESAAPAIFKKAINGGTISTLETEQYKTALLLFFGRHFKKRGWVMQYHYGALRSINPPMFRKLGPDTGFDAISSYECSGNIAKILAALQETNELPKTILYSLNPNDDAMLVTIAGCFSESGIVSKVQHGSAWWFNDTKSGMENQLNALASKGLLGGFIGMLTDSRSFVSYPRHEYFRRILCNLIGEWVENGEYPNDIKFLGKLAQDISYNNVKKYFGF
jgi:glucuronate isomerase